MERLDSHETESARGTVLLCVPYPLEVPGGVAVHGLEVVKNLNNLGWKAFICSPSLPGGKSRDNFGENVIRLGTAYPINFRGTTAWWPIYPESPWRINQVLEEIKPDVIHLHNMQLSLVLTQILLQADGIKILTNHASDQNHKYHTALKILIGALELLRKGRVFRIDALTAVSQVAKEDAQKVYPAEYYIVRNGIDLERFTRNGPAWPRADDEDPVINYWGRLEPRKGVHDLISAIAIAQNQLPNIKLRIAGNGTQRQELEVLSQRLGIKQHVKFYGEISETKKPAFIRGSDIAVFVANGNESHGIVIDEAWGCGKPVIVSNIPGFNNHVENHRTGILVKHSSPTDLAAAIVELNENQILRQKIIDCSSEEVKKYSWARTAQKYSGTYEKLLSTGRRRR